MITAHIVEHFQITGRGTVIVIDKVTDLPIGRCLQATIQFSDGASLDYGAWKEWLLRRDNKPLEDEAFLIVDAPISHAPIGAVVTLKISDP